MIEYYCTYTLDDIETVAQTIINKTPNKTILFYGDLGSGKTTLIQAIAKVLGVEDKVCSPSFGLVNEYASASVKIYHFDFYRLQTEEEAYDIGFEDYLDASAWVFIEWPDKIKSLLPEIASKIYIKFDDIKTRNLELKL